MEMWPTSNKSKLSTREAGLHQADGAGLTTIKINNNQQQSTPLPCEDLQCSEKMWKRGHMFLYAIGCMFLHRCTRLPVERVGCCMQWLESGHWQFGVKSLRKHHVQHKFTSFYITSCPSGSSEIWNDPTCPYRNSLPQCVLSLQALASEIAVSLWSRRKCTGKPPLTYGCKPKKILDYTKL